MLISCNLLWFLFFMDCARQKCFSMSLLWASQASFFRAQDSGGQFRVYYSISYYLILYYMDLGVQFRPAPSGWGLPPWGLSIYCVDVCTLGLLLVCSIFPHFLSTVNLKAYKSLCTLFPYSGLSPVILGECKNSPAAQCRGCSNRSIEPQTSSLLGFVGVRVQVRVQGLLGLGFTLGFRDYAF